MSAPKSAVEEQFVAQTKTNAVPEPGAFDSPFTSMDAAKVPASGLALTSSGTPALSKPSFDGGCTEPSPNKASGCTWWYVVGKTSRDHAREIIEIPNKCHQVLLVLSRFLTDSKC